ncbi:uncharacterized protein SEPMUDRAFT_137601 [Sphaerulina musiva SO2202]|uniref:Glutaredoxin-like protein n=1 Tax=Sphaerulina musiva (strain SO2202) TaxID=692275 RepID=N1QMU5_SPHMS|nr:uncharacterized protein SEPMUDRAFT_137601 [Sphaerulina musiva SO2202]EMF16864.1 hypothetical protein SEPMUDRAFT_137601 [Sphaerulina musiva SO2202]
MRAASRLLQHSLRLTFFTHEHCTLCQPVKDVMSTVWDRRPFGYEEIDILAPENNKWKQLYEFDIPVLHVDRTSSSNGTTTAAARKLKHRWTQEQLEKVMDEVENS